jgi:hypothetical protein
MDRRIALSDPLGQACSIPPSPYCSSYRLGEPLVLHVLMKSPIEPTRMPRESTGTRSYSWQHPVPQTYPLQNIVTTQGYHSMWLLHHCILPPPYAVFLLEHLPYSGIGSGRSVQQGRVPPPPSTPPLALIHDIVLFPAHCHGSGTHRPAMQRLMSASFTPGQWRPRPRTCGSQCC